MVTDTTDRERFEDIAEFLDAVGEIDGVEMEMYTIDASTPGWSNVKVEVSVTH